MNRVSGARDLFPALVLGLVALASETLRGIAGEIAILPLLGAFPGLALAWALLPAASRTTRWTVGLVLAPLVSSIAGWALLSAHVDAASAARLIGWGAFALWIVMLVRGRRPQESLDAGERAPSHPAMWLLSGGLAVAIALPHVINPWMLVKSDAWNHCGIVYQILERGIPPEDPRFAGLHLNYVWFFNLYIGLLARVHDGNPFVLMSAMNVLDVALMAWLAYVLGWMVWRSRGGALGTALLTCCGFNALMLLLWPLRGIRGLSEFAHGVVHTSWSPPLFRIHSWEIMSDLGAPHTWIENFVDKFATGTSINYTWLLMLLLLWAWVRLMRSRQAGAWIIAALASAGMQLWHGVVGLSVIPVAACAVVFLLALRRAWPWLPPASRLVEFGIAILLGFLATVPYIFSISRGWDAKQSGLHVSPIHLDLTMTLTLVTSCAFALAVAWSPMVSAWRERNAEPMMLTTYAAGIYAFSLLIALPNQNEAKFAFEAFVPLALLGGANFSNWIDNVRARTGRAGLAVLAVLLAAPLVLTLVGFTLDRERLTYPALNPAPGENEMYAWISSHTPRDMVFVDDHYRDLVMVRARRQMYLGSASGPERAAFPLAQVLERRAVMADLYGAADSLDRDVAALAALGRPACVLIRSQDADTRHRAGAALAARPDLFRPIYERSGFVLYAVEMPAVKSEAPRP
jgi:hypothetical protein